MGKGLEAALAQIRKNYGENAIMTMSNDAALVDIEVVPTGILSVDIALGVGGIPRGRIIEVYGVPKGGKTTLVMHIVAQAQKIVARGAAYIDAEHALDAKYMRVVGINLDDLYLSQPVNGEMALEIAEMLTRSGEMVLIVVDSVDALVPKSVVESEMEDQHRAPLPRLMGQGLRKLKAVVRKSNTCLVFINQERSTMNPQGAKKTTSGGFALKYYADVRIEVVRTGYLKMGDEGEPYGQTVKVKVVASKVASPFKETELDLVYGQGFSREGDLLNLAEEARIVVKSGAWYTYGKAKLGQGRGNAIEWLKSNPDEMAAIVKAVRKVKGLDKDGEQ